MINFGAVPIGSVLPVFFDSFAGATGASITLTGLAITDVEIFKGTSMTQRTPDTGVVLIDTDGIDLDGITGIHGFSIDTGDNTDAGFFAAGSFYTVVVSAVTIDTQTVNFVAATFRLLAAEAIAGKPKADVDAWLGTAASTPTVAGVPNVNAKTWNDLATVALPLVPTTAGRTLDVTAANKVNGVVLVDTLTTYTGNTVQTGDTYALANGASGFSAIKTVVDALATTIGAAGAGLTATATAVWAVATRLLTAGTNIVLAKGTGVTGFTDLDAAGVRTAVGLASANLDTQLDAIPTNTDLSTALGTADDAVLAVLSTQSTTLSTIAGYIDTEVAAIKAKTDSLTFTQAGHVDANVQRINDVAITGDGSGSPFGV